MPKIPEEPYDEDMISLKSVSNLPIRLQDAEKLLREHSYEESEFLTNRDYRAGTDPRMFNRRQAKLYELGNQEEPEVLPTPRNKTNRESKYFPFAGHKPSILVITPPIKGSLSELWWDEQLNTFDLSSVWWSDTLPLEEVRFRNFERLPQLYELGLFIWAFQQWKNPPTVEANLKRLNAEEKRIRFNEHFGFWTASDFWVHRNPQPYPLYVPRKEFDLGSPEKKLRIGQEFLEDTREVLHWLEKYHAIRIKNRRFNKSDTAVPFGGAAKVFSDKESLATNYFGNKRT